jgi:hypothetical protein
MFSNRIKFFVFLFLLVTSIFVVLSSENVNANSPSIPRVWDDAEMAALQLPLVDSTASPKQIPSEYYYRIPVRTIYKSYPVYAPGKEPAGYLEWLKQQEPESTFDASALKTEADWLKAGELVFNSPNSYEDIARIRSLLCRCDAVLVTTKCRRSRVCGIEVHLNTTVRSRRLSDDYVPTGFKGAGVNSRAVRGHAFGLDLSPVERHALIAFLKTL